MPRAKRPPSNSPNHVNGRFAPGNNANPGGRPKGLAARVREAVADGADLVKFLVEVYSDPEQQMKDRLTAANMLLDRGFGKPVQEIEGNGAMILKVVYGDGGAEVEPADDEPDAIEADYRPALGLPSQENRAEE